MSSPPISSVGTWLPELLADCYRSASLSGVDMHALVDVLEAVRSRAGDGHYELWDKLNAEVAKADPAGLRPVLMQVRDDLAVRVVDDLVARISTTAPASPAGWAEWLVAFCEAILANKPELCLALPMGTGAPHPADASDQPGPDDLRRAVEAAIAGRLAHLYPVFLRLGGCDLLSTRHRAIFLSLAGLLAMSELDRPSLAKAHMDLALELAPSEPQVISAWGSYLLMGKSRTGEARSHFQAAIAADDRLASPYCGIGDCCLVESERADAERWYQRAIDSTDDVSGYSRLLNLYGDSVRFPERKDRIAPIVATITAYDRLEAFGAYISASEAHRYNGEFSAAHGWADRAIELIPGEPLAYIERAEVFDAEGKPTMAKTSFLAAIEADPDDHHGYAAIAGALERWGEHEASAARYREAADRFADLAVTFRAKAVALEYGNSPSATLELEAFALVELETDNQAARRAVFSLINQQEREGDLAACIELNGRLRKLCGPEFEGEYQDRLGTLWYNQGEYDKALAAYQAAQAEAPTDAQVRRNAALALRQLQRWDEARQALAEALEIDGIGWLHAEQLALVENAEGNAEYQKSHFAAAAERYQRATDLAPDDAVYFSNLALASEARPGVGVDGAQAAAAAMETAARLDPKNDEYGQRLQRLRETVRLTPQFGARWLSTSFRADQLVVEVALDLVPFISDSPDEPGLPIDVQSAVDRLRADIAAQYGVTVPPITFKDQLALPDGAYRASFGGVPFMAGSVDVDLRLFTGGLPALEALGVTSSPGLSPLNGRPAHWIEHSEVPKVEAAGLEVWSVVDYVLYDLARVVLKNLKVFIGVEEVSALLKWNATAETAPFLEDPLERSTLTRVLSGLVAEEVTIAPVAAICAAVSSGRAKGDDCTAIIERVRSLPEICQRLPGNWPGQQLLRLSDPLAAMVRKALWRDGNEPVLAIDPGECQEALAAIRTAVQDIDDQPVSIAVSADLRPMVRKLVELEFPNLWVLSEQEVGVDGQTRYIGEVSLT